MPHLRLLLLSCAGLLLALWGCTAPSLQRAEQARARGAYYQAEQLYRQLYRATPRDKRSLRARYALGAGEAALRGRRATTARQLLQTALRLQPQDSLARALLQEMGRLQGQGASSLGGDTLGGYRLQLFAPLRSARSDYGMTFTADGRELFFTSHRASRGAGGETSPVTGEPYGRLYRLSQRPDGSWSASPDSVGGLAERAGEVGTPALSPDGQTLYYTYVSSEAHGEAVPQIYRAERTAGGAWGAGTPLELFGDSTILAAHPTLSPSGRWLFFVSDAPGGRGGKDLYVAERRGAGFGVPLPLGEGVNSPRDELFPHAVTDSLLYFASDRDGGLGGLDLYQACLQADGTYRVEPLPVPLNSPEDDYAYVPSPQPAHWPSGEGLAEVGLLATARGDLLGRPHLYEVQRLSQRTLLEVEVLDREGYPLAGALVRLVGKTSRQAEQVVTTDATGRATLEVAPAVEYVMLASAKDYLNQYVRLATESSQQSETYSVSFYLASRVRVEQLREIYYAFDRADLLPSSQEALQRLLTLLRDNPEVRIELRAHADRHGRAGYNQRLSERRVQAVVSYLTEQGIAPQRLVARGYGQEEPFVVTRGTSERYSFLREGTALTEAFIRALPSTEEQDICDQLNRRTEFRVVE